MKSWWMLNVEGWVLRSARRDACLSKNCRLKPMRNYRFLIFLLLDCHCLPKILHSSLFVLHFLFRAFPSRKRTDPIRRSFPLAGSWLLSTCKPSLCSHRQEWARRRWSAPQQRACPYAPCYTNGHWLCWWAVYPLATQPIRPCCPESLIL